MNLRVAIFAIAITAAVVTFGHCADAPKPADQATPTEQAEHKWEAYSKDKQGITFYYEKDTIVYGSDGTIKVWRKREFPVRSNHKAIVALDEIDCFKQKYRALELRVVGWDDSEEAFKRVSEWATIYGDSPEEYFLDTQCKELRKKKTK